MPDAKYLDITLTTWSYDSGFVGSPRDWIPPIITVNLSVVESSLLLKSRTMSFKSGVAFSTEEARNTPLEMPLDKPN